MPAPPRIVARGVRLRTSMLRILEQIIGVLLVVAATLDIFLTVLYARIGTSGAARFGTGVVSAKVAEYVWRGFRALAPRFGRAHADFLSFAGSVIIVLYIVVWVGMIILGDGMFIQPHLGSSIVATSGHTPTDFATALSVAAASLSTAGVSHFNERTATFRLILGLEPFLGMSVVSLTLMYLMQVYSALQRRNTLGLKVKMLAGGTADAAEILAGLGVEEHFTAGYSTMAELGAEVTNLNETHAFYPVLFYFRYREACYATSRFSLVLLDMVSLVQSAVGGESEWLRRTAAIKQIWLATTEMITTLEGAYVPHAQQQQRAVPDAATRERWRLRHAAAIRRLRSAGIETVADEQAGFEEYVSLRSRWQQDIESLVQFMAYSMEQIDPEGTGGRV